MKMLTVVFPPNKKADEIKDVCLTVKMKSKHLFASLLSSPYITQDGTKIFAPPGWLPPAPSVQ